eukprot:scpid69095/ scgid30867/ Transmembrane protein 97
MALGTRALDWFFFVSFIAHIAVTGVNILLLMRVFFKGVLPESVEEFTISGAKDVFDPLVPQENPPVWFLVIIVNEIVFHLPLFFLAVLAFYSQSAKYNWIRIPCMLYAAQALASIQQVMGEVLLIDYTNQELGPKTPAQRRVWLGINLPFLIMPLLLLVRTSLSTQMWPPKVKTQ